MSYSCNTACITVLNSYTVHVATEEELKLVKQMLEQKQREINDLTSLLAMKEGKKSDVMMNFVILLTFYINNKCFSIVLEEELDTLKNKILEMSSLTETKGKLLTTSTMYTLVFSCL